MITKILNKIGVPTSSAQFIINKVQIAHMIDGRVRVIYDDLKHDNELVQQVAEKLSEVKEIIEYKINQTTGSVLIVYDVNTAHKNEFLNEFLTLAKSKYKE